MRALAIALASGLALAALPAMAQQSDSGGINGIIRNLDNQLNNRGDSRTMNGSYDRGQSRDYNNGGNYSGSSMAPSGSYSRADADEQRRLDDMQAQLNRAQQQLNEQYRQFYQSQRR
jgi:hypothetical protein